jgi:YgiT-type zinc finger domain-containing protein
METDDNNIREFCESCHAGSLQPCRAPYAHWHDGQFIVVPGIPAWRCDFCSEVFFDSAALTRLVLLLGSEANLEGQRRWRTAGLDDSSGKGLGDRRLV